MAAVFCVYFPILIFVPPGGDREQKTGDGSLSFPKFTGKDREPSPVFPCLSLSQDCRGYIQFGGIVAGGRLRGWLHGTVIFCGSCFLGDCQG